MAENVVRQFGLWDSLISPAALAEEKRLGRVEWDSDGETLIWLEGRSDRNVLVCLPPGGDAPRDLTSDLNVRAEVGYGGGDFTVHGGFVYFVVHKLGCIYRQAIAEGPARPVTPQFGKAAEPVVSPDGKWLAYVHHDEEDADRLALVDTAGRYWPQILTGGHDFYMQPRWSPDGTHLAWIAWDHPNMPWDGTKLYVAPVVPRGDELPQIGVPEVIAGGDEVAIFQPEFSPDGRQLLYVSDESGWSQLAARDLETGQTRWLTEDNAEYAMPAWFMGRRTYAIASGGRVIAARGEQGFDSLVQIDLDSGTSLPITELTEYREVLDIAAAPQGETIALIGSGPRIPPRVVVRDLARGNSRIAARASGETLVRDGLSECEPLQWTTAGGETAYGLYYPPASLEFTGTGQPPLIVIVHGGPTSQVKAKWNPSAQFFVTRGYGVLFVNYRGSTGYGREYMLKLRGNWGICDVEDAISGAKYLAETGRVDPERRAIMGGSAGGFTVLQTMVRHPEAFTVGINLYGVANHFTLAADTHKFESRYLDSLLGPLPEASAVYRDRSPVFFADQIQRPLAIYQGDIDQVVPRDQSDSIAHTLQRNGIPHVYEVYEGEGHGWRKRETIEHFYQSVEAFLRQHLLFS